jgi:metallo-beta-lactamase family protein
MLADLVRRKRLSPLKVYVDSPMANAATRITLATPICSIRKPAN